MSTDSSPYPVPENRLCEVTAELASPALVDSWWPEPLDALLAASVDPASLVVQGRTSRAVQLPLARWKQGLNNQWVWVASCALLERQVDRQQVTRLLCPDPLRWYSAGDPAGVLRLLTDVTHVGAGRSTGSGRVASWSVDDRGPWSVDGLSDIPWRPDGLLGRPLPVRAAAVLGLDPNTVDTLPGAIRPPNLIPPRSPEGGRQWRVILAPWTRRPLVPHPEASASARP